MTDEVTPYPDEPRVPKMSSLVAQGLRLEMEDRRRYDELSTWGRFTTKPPPGAGCRIDMVYDFFAVFFKTLLVAVVAIGATWLLWGTWPFVTALMVVGSVIVIYLAAGRPGWRPKNRLVLVTDGKE